ncbi:MAG TPA: hypothetical protein VKB39_06235 [Candidatus Baltobacteraceae bacterium]|nr:hypothetical protein [Candidatus Baltobacteraceae bacterium]
MASAARIWQRVVFALCLAGLCAVAEGAWATYKLQGDVFGGAVNGPVTEAPFLDRFESVVPGSLADRSGIHAGDALDLRLMAPEVRYWERNEFLAGAPIRLPLVRNGAVSWLSVKPEPYTHVAFWTSSQWSFAWDFWLGSALSICIGAMLMWRRPENTEVRMLALTLVLINLGENLFPINGFLTPWPKLDVALNVVAQFIFSTGVALLAGYALLFGRPVSRARRALTAIAYAVAAVSALVWTGAAQGGTGPGGLLGIAGLWSGKLDLHAWLTVRPLPSFALVVGPSLIALLSAIVAVRAANGAERTRVAWATGALAVLYLFGIGTIQSYFTTNIVLYYWILNTAWIIAPLGLVYALLNRRLLDVGFALNRAAVFTGVSLFVVGAFTLVEWALGGWLHSAGRVANVVVSAAIALGLGLSLHQIHARVDRVVDNVFFRKRHEDERALKRFAREVSFITDPDVVVARAIEVLVRHADAASVTFALYDGAGYYGNVGENDAALVALRASHEVVDLHLVDSALKGEFAYPLSCRGRLVGALVLGPKTSCEPYAPDESAAIAQIGHGVGVALDLLGARAIREDGEILVSLRSLEALSLATNEALAGLPDAIAERLRGLQIENETSPS